MKGRLGIAIAVVAVGLMSIPSTAAAKTKCVGNDAGSFVCFKTKGDKFTITDTSQNEMSAAVYWRTDYGRSGIFVNTRGKDTKKTYNRNFREGRIITFWAVDIDTPTNTYKHWSADAKAQI
jgi:hypothetical protein